MSSQEQRSKRLKRLFRDAAFASGSALSAFLKEFAKSHSGCYFQYTTISALKGMYENACLLLTRATELNDVDEMKIQSAEKERTYVASFSALRSESIAMWTLYGTPAKEGIRIRFPKKTIDKLLSVVRGEDKKLFAYGVKSLKRIGTCKKAVQVEEANFTDVVYRGKNALTWLNLCVAGLPQLDQMIEGDSLLGQIKDDFWRYENEVRLIVKLKSDPKNYPPKIAIPVKRLLKDMTVVLGPCFADGDECEFIKEVEEKEKVKFTKSVCTRKVRFPKHRPCKGCKHCTVHK